MESSSLSGITTFVLHKVAVASRRAIAEQLTDRHGLTLWEFAALTELDGRGPAAQNVVATRLGMDPSDMVRLMDQLMARRLVSRERDVADRRRYKVALTAKGRRLLVAGRQVVRQVEQSTLAPLSPAERAALHELVVKIYRQAD
jgi:DNA-binding MarR family transcriptional regulator